MLPETIRDDSVSNYATAKYRVTGRPAYQMITSVIFLNIRVSILLRRNLMTKKRKK